MGEVSGRRTPMSEVQTKNVATSADEAAKIAPRAEFRVFGHGIVDIVEKKMWEAGAKLFKVRRMPAETYILSRKTDAANVKVRDGLLDIKTLVGLTPQGYEIFQPRGKFQFPVKKSELQTILAALEVEIALDAETYTFDDFVAIARAHPDLAAVSVEKVRHGFTVDGIICEFAEVWFNGALMESACCESEDHAGMERAIAALGIADLANTNYLRAAKRVVGL
jgi:hypothetical protein